MPAWEQLEAGKKRLALAWHRRAGKDDVCLHWAATCAMTRVGGYWHMLPQHNQARKAIWDAINPGTGRRRIDDAFPLALRDSTREQDMFIRFKNGSTWQVVGSDNYNALVGSPPVGVVFSEYALSDPSSWAFIRPILAENGGWALFISTPRGTTTSRSSCATRWRTRPSGSARC
jgi:phage terminase large subunit